MKRAFLLPGTLLAVTGLLMAGCGPAEPQNQTSANDVGAPVNETSAVPLPQAPLSRAELLQAVMQAASAAAAGSTDAAPQRSLDGRGFELRIRFGCRGQANPLRDSWLGWAQDAEAGTLRVRAMPTITMDDAVVAQLGAESFEAVEGFWVPRPWLLQAVCPATAAIGAGPARPEVLAEQPEENAPADQAVAPEPKPEMIRPRVGIAQFFTEADPRTGRRGERAYEAVKTLDADQPISSQGFNLILSGRLRALPGRGVIQCVASNPDAPPDCIASATFDRVWIEVPETGEVLAEWRPAA